VRFLVCVSTALEGYGFPAVIAGHPIRMVRTGVGPVNAAIALTREIASARPDAVIACGVGGAYPGSGLAVGDVVCAESETYGDLGAESPQGFLDMQALGFPIIDGAAPLFNHLPLDLFPAPRRVPFVTCSTCTGTDARAQAIASRTGGAVESMEGAAIVHVATLMDVPVGEIRGISNLCGARDRASWRVAEAGGAAREALVAWIEAGGC
jgi:futalosine hydrolase